MRARGFTLIELLVAILLFALMSTMAYRGLDAMARANERVVSDSDHWHEVSLFFERFASDVAQPSVRAVRDAAGGKLPQWWGRVLAEPANADAQLEFTRKSPPGQDDVRIGYRLRADTLELLIWPVLDRSPASMATVYPLLERVASLQLRYLDSRGAWSAVWPVPGRDEPLPRAVSVEIALSGEPPVQRIFALP